MTTRTTEGKTLPRRKKVIESRPRLPASIEQGPVTLGARYRRLIRACESLPENRSGADKTWVERCQRAFREHYARARRVR